MLSALLGLGGSLISGLQSSKNAKLQMAKQEEQARNQVQWRVTDAKKAGVHPSVALGMSPMSYSPVSTDVPDWGAHGQNLGRAITAQMTKQDKEDDYTKAMKRLSVERGELENTLLASKIAVNSQAATPPAMPTAASLEQGENIKDREYFGEMPDSPAAQDYSDQFGDVVGDAYGVDRWARWLLRNPQIFNVPSSEMLFKRHRAGKGRKPERILPGKKLRRN